MTVDLMPFIYEGAQLRTIVIDGEPWFVAADACRMLDLRDTSSALKMVDEDDRTHLRRSDTPQFLRSIAPQVQSLIAVNESGLYALIFQSNKDTARRVRRWVTGEVLPAIRKTGGYGQAVNRLTPLEYARQLVAAEERAAIEEAARIEAEQHARALTAPASAWSHLAESSGDYSVADAAKVLSRDSNISIGRDRLFRFMQGEGWVFRDASTDAWKAYQTQVDTGRLVEKLGHPYLHEPSGERRLPAPTIRITAKGLAALHRRLGGGDALPIPTAAPQEEH
ncbi:phage antirepressor [Nocardia panacis]|uniref:phage antirepressor n=1 Tax=Nocardia panacis TaxID=2340916 RepID=UPI001EF0837C|nr:phage antirepressor KilAC domain-containing protein [Nocardia panacis]